jgi:hypothetical protein
MHSIKMTLAIAGTLLTTILLAGCQSDQSKALKELKDCKSQNSLLEFRITEYQQIVEDDKKGISGRDELIKSLVNKAKEKTQEYENRIALLEKENDDLRKALAKTPDGSKRILEGVEEIRRMQREAAEKLRQQEVQKPTKPVPAAPSIK